jgi:hypothetical protein
MASVNSNETGIVGFTYDDAFSVILDAMTPSVLSAPKNESKQSSISGPSNAAKASRCDFSSYLYDTK